MSEQYKDFLTDICAVYDDVSYRLAKKRYECDADFRNSVENGVRTFLEQNSVDSAAQSARAVDHPKRITSESVVATWFRKVVDIGRLPLQPNSVSNILEAQVFRDDCTREQIGEWQIQLEDNPTDLIDAHSLHVNVTSRVSATEGTRFVFTVLFKDSGNFAPRSIRLQFVSSIEETPPDVVPAGKSRRFSLAAPNLEQVKLRFAVIS